MYKRQLYYSVLHNKYKKSAAAKNKLSFRTLAGINLYNQVDEAEADVYKRQGRRLTLVEECHDRWVENARTLRSGNSRNSRKEVRP